MRGAIPPLPQYALMASCSVKTKHKGNFTFTFTYNIKDAEINFLLHNKVIQSPLSI
jgi:hypothetical protein